MRVVLLAAGAAGMYCGSCLRDNRLAATLREMGRDVLLVPLYTPLRTDEADASDGRVFLGGINVYLQQRVPLLRHVPRLLDGWLDSPRLLARLAGRAGSVRPEQVADLAVSVLAGRRGHQRKEVQRLVDGLRGLRPSLVSLPNLMLIGLAGPIRESLGVPVVCELTGEDLFVDAMPEPQRGRALELIREQARHVDAFMAVTRYYAGHAAEMFGLPRERVAVVPMGLRVEDFEAARPAAAGGPVTIGYLARVAPEKGLLELAEAFAQLRADGHDVRLRAAGYLGESERGYLERVHGLVRERGAAERFEYLGEVSRAEKVALLGSLHVLSVPAPYREAKGLYVLEALAAGVPVVQPRHGSFPELVEDTGGGLLYDPGEAGGLARALERLVVERELRETLAARGRAAVHERYRDRVMAAAAWSLYEQLVSQPARTQGSC